MGVRDHLPRWLGGTPRVTQLPATRIVFSAVPQPTLPVDQLLMHLWARQGTIGRAEALTVPAVLRGRNMICSIATLPLEAVDDRNPILPRPLFRQLDSNTPNVVVMAQTLEDLLFDAVAWWRIVGFDDEGMPSRIQRYAPDQVSLQPPADYERGLLPSGLATEGVIWMGGRQVPYDQVIRFDSPNPGLLAGGAATKTIGRAVALDHAAQLYATSPRRRGFFTPQDGVDPASDEAIRDALDEWEKASADRVDGYVPAALQYNAIQDSTPAELQLVQMQQRVTLDLANALGIDPEDLGVNTTSRTYQNATDRRQDRINETLAPYMRAITDRLAMPDVTREGVRVRFGLRDYLKADPRTRAEVQQIHAGLGVIDATDIRDEEGYEARTVSKPVPASPVAGAGPSPALRAVAS
jgi:hypothetical protein